ncbi:hypothetical protein [Pseudomonas sp. 5P_3.1_Bac2]|uniref:hypothetical protein n=1 Tax=Pseudomonas sp. 5P_3.1_Bac2 TaxID=2971617 RepID=UPI0021C5A436|nr:hypothetical protein [Pseudomonas sp. 5P_3.1_Bac2]MCU1717693.1 hypothetical protein [Pseudomonas sp. 5P_3.1_Bac2]
MYQSAKEVAIRGARAVQNVASVGKALGGKTAAVMTVGAAGMTAGAANAAITVPPEVTEVFTDLATAFGVLMVAAVALFATIRGGVALFKLAGRLFSAAGA